MAVSLTASSGDKDLVSLVRSITLLETVVNDEDTTHVMLVQALRSAISRRVPTSQPGAAAHGCVADALEAPAVDGVMHLYGLLKIPLADRLDLALAKARADLLSRGGGVELVSIKPPDTVELRLSGPASDGVERVIRRHCPEIRHIHPVSCATASRA